MPRVHFPVLDSLRAVGAVAVVVTHVAFWSGSYTTHQTIGPLLARMDVGVAIFFVLSGFLLSRPWLLAAQDGRRPPRITRYFNRRFWRIFPVYWVTAGIALALLEENQHLTVGDWVSALLLVDIYHFSTFPAGLTHMWSLATEVSFYLALPLLMLIVVGRRPEKLRPRRVVTVLVLLAVINVVWTSVVARAPYDTDAALLQWLPGYFTWFGAGILLAFLEVRMAAGTASPRTQATINRLVSTPGSLWCAVGGLLLLASTPIAGPTSLIPPIPSEAVTKNLLYAAIGLLAVFTGVFARPEGTYWEVMTSRLTRRLGVISYGIFCIHLPVLHLVVWLSGYELFSGGFWWILAATLLITLPAAELLYRLVETPTARLARRSPARGPKAKQAPSTTNAQ